MSTRKSARRHRGRNRQTPRSPSPKAVASLAQRRATELEALIPDPNVRTILQFWRDSEIEKPLFVYLIQEDRGGPVKIGKAHDPIGRLRNLQCGNPHPLVIRALVLASVDLEEDLHHFWGRICHVRGEWFGHGYENLLIELALEAAIRQAEDFALNLPLHRLIEHAGYVMSPFHLKEKAA